MAERAGPKRQGSVPALQRCRGAGRKHPRRAVAPRNRSPGPSKRAIGAAPQGDRGKAIFVPSSPPLQAGPIILHEEALQYLE